MTPNYFYKNTTSMAAVSCHKIKAWFPPFSPATNLGHYYKVLQIFSWKIQELLACADKDDDLIRSNIINAEDLWFFSKKEKILQLITWQACFLNFWLNFSTGITPKWTRILCYSLFDKQNPDPWFWDLLSQIFGQHISVKS